MLYIDEMQQAADTGNQREVLKVVIQDVSLVVHRLLAVALRPPTTSAPSRSNSTSPMANWIQRASYRNLLESITGSNRQFVEFRDALHNLVIEEVIHTCL